MAKDAFDRRAFLKGAAAYRSGGHRDTDGGKLAGAGR